MTWRIAYLTTMAALLQRRKDLKITQATMAERLGVHLRTFRRWENGEDDPQAMLLFKWAGLLNVPLGANSPHSEDGGGGR
ncbi:helix-turn-helix domain-containing protein [Rhodospirillum sp. A1_3_36]|uniref:helix-turn-helix domain-containing protein n=1 Tax=Rhodospirillum sp. A1_3_36 TaxID=3391666 RepID=UPI0039A548F8